MARNPEYEFVSTDLDSLIEEMAEAYSLITGTSLNPASPEYVFVRWVAGIIVQERSLMNYIGNQNIPSRAEGENLDALAELFHATGRPQAEHASAICQFTISGAQTFDIEIPAGTRVTDPERTYYWDTTAPLTVPAGSTTVSGYVECETLGSEGNGWPAGQLSVIVDVFPYFSSVANTTTSAGGADEADDTTYFDLLRKSMDAFSSAGARGAYEYIAKSVDQSIKDVKVLSESAGEVDIYILMDNPEDPIAPDDIKAKVLAACSADTVRPLTDLVTVEDITDVSYAINVTYYRYKESSMTAAETAEAVNDAIRNYITWQSSVIGRDINPNYLMGLLMQTGIKRATITSPVYTVIGNTTPSIGVLSATPTVTDGGEEDE